MESVTQRAPGKLYIAGEYAILEPTNPAILVAVDEFVTVQVSPSVATGTIHSKQYDCDAVRWVRRGTQIVVDNRENPFHYILSAIHYVEEYVRENGKKLRVFDIRVNSELDSDGGLKYGLGSSAAVTVATVKALLQFYKVKAQNDVIFKIAAIAHLSVQGNGSLGDVAASVYGGWLAYRSFDRQWLLENLKTMSLTDLIKAQWPGLMVKSLPQVPGMGLVIGWSQKPASTSRLVEQTDEEKQSNQAFYRQFVADSRACVESMIEGFDTGNIAMIKSEINHNRQLLHDFSVRNKIDIEIPRLADLIDIADKCGGAAKTSGAGNGDCGIVIVDSHTDVDSMKKQWKSAGILPLDTHVFEYGPQAVD